MSESVLTSKIVFKMIVLRYLLLFCLFSIPFQSVYAQSARIKLETQSLKTYPFDDPDPVPIWVSNPKIYPYFKYEGYQQEGSAQDWQVVHLENDHIEVWVLPEVGGKVWGAREKSTGEEFIYRNEVMKFRNIAMRGPWTSGGIEFNFGIIGHHPSTATPVDYKIVEEEDGSVSCWVGNMDLASRTQWRVRIHLPKDKAYFETQALWYNPTALHQSYYNWMTGAAFASDDLEFYCPGDQYLEHSGDPRPWPNEYGRHIAEYRENDFLSHKSYHVVGEYNDFFGGYFKDQGYGFGHWSPYEAMPGQKLWLWSLARNGGIWEELLTDTDGQYIEFQAGRLFNQYSPGSDRNPITQAVFPPHTTDQWQELWFPVKSIGGLTDVSPSAVLHVEQQDGRLQIGINALEKAAGTLKVYDGERLAFEKAVSLDPMGVLQESIPWPATQQPFRITVEEMDLDYSNAPGALSLDRPFRKPRPDGVPTFELNYRAGLEAMDFREYARAEQLLQASLEDNPAHLDALAALAEIYYRQGRHEAGLEPARRALSIDTYHPAANFMAGILYQARQDPINALEALGWAARSMEYRSAAYGIMAQIYLSQDRPEKAVDYGMQALDFNRYNVQAQEVLAVAYRLQGNKLKAQEIISTLVEMDPLSHFAAFEQSLLDGTHTSKQQFVENIRHEMPYQTFLEVALNYVGMGQKDLALSVLELAPDQPLVTIWQAFLKNDPGLLTSAVSDPADLVFPFRRETIDALRWATGQNQHWKLNYYLALNLMGKDRKEEANQIFASLQDHPDYAYFYLTRAHTREATDPQGAQQDLERALTMAPDSWRIRHALTQHHHRQNEYEAAVKTSEAAYRQYPENYTLGMDQVQALIYTGQYEPALKILETLKVLPFEGASESRRLYEWAHLGRALELIRTQQYRPAIRILEAYKQWPERLGVGKPFDPDERLADHLLAYSYDRSGAKAAAEKARERMLAFTRQNPLRHSLDAVLAFQLMTPKALSELAIHQYSDPEKLPVATRWALAKAQGAETEAKVIEQAHRGLFGSPAFQFLRAALELE